MSRDSQPLTESQKALSDSLMNAYLWQMWRRESGETSGVKSLSLVMSGESSVCCSAPATYTKRLSMVCYACRRPYRAKSWSAPRMMSAKGSDGTMRVRETRSRRSEFDADKLREAVRTTRASFFIEKRPRSSTEKRWQACLYAWGLYLLSGSVEAARLRGGMTLSTWMLGERMNFARKVVWKRAVRRPDAVRHALDGVRMGGR